LIIISKDLEKTSGCKIITIAAGQFKKILYARVRVKSRSKDGNFDRVETAYAAGMGLV
jgi:hypothetical protein